MTGCFTIRSGYAVYRGPMMDGGPIHRHAAFQVAAAVRGETAMVDPSGTRYQAATLVVSPMTPHRILATGDLLTYFVEPHCVFADRLRARYAAGITAAPELQNLREEDLEQMGGRPSPELDPRLVEAMEVLRTTRVSMPDLASSVGLSPQRLRALARRELGMPLTRWRVWSQLRTAAEALQEGQSLADAAATAGFSDQAHLTRQMNVMMGLTPAAALPAMRGHPLRAT